MFALAERLGMTVGELGRRMSSAEVAEWIAFDRIREQARKEEIAAARAANGVRGIINNVRAKRKRRRK